MQGGSLVTAFLDPKVITRLSRNKNEILIKKERYYCFEIAHNRVTQGNFTLTFSRNRAWNSRFTRLFLFNHKSV